ncbi:hypothetical protein [Psychroflexus aestuariivivens]|uniref:hypothetical protein n=1 Tax=Psychroflexus aestuariivivens TaxID=1795040 RepID=UPI000FD9CE30|nr:hypothetical protein [Psychroflexus aestuariivivens]
MNEHLPNRNDKLFKEEINPTFGAWLKNPANKFFLYSEGYKEAGKKLWEFCIENNFYANTLIYPLVFNYRQFIELRIKELMIMGYKYVDDNKDFADEHSLLKLWCIYRNEILVNIETIDEEILDNVERVIKQFNTEDPKSMCFRYPVSRGPHRKEHINRETIDLNNFKNVIDRLIYFFDWQWDMISHYQELKDEMIADMYREYW